MSGGDIMQKYLDWEKSGFLAPKRGHMPLEETGQFFNPFTGYTIGQVNVNIDGATVPTEPEDLDYWSKKIAEYTKEQMDDEILRRTLKG